MDLLQRMCDHVAVIAQGGVLAAGRSFALSFAPIELARTIYSTAQSRRAS